MIKPVSILEVKDVWEDVRPLLVLAIEHSNNEYSIKDVFTNILEGTYQLWLVIEDGKLRAAITTCFTQYPQKTILELCHCGGEGINEWGSDVTEVIGAFAKASGATDLITYARTGAERLYPKFGYDKQYTVMRKAL